MALETAEYITDLVITNPAAGDAKSQGDDHLRLLKTTLLNSFSGFTTGSPTLAFGTANLAANVITLTLDITPADYAELDHCIFIFSIAGAANTGSVTMQVNALGSAMPLFKSDWTTNFASGELQVDQWIVAIYDDANTDFIALNMPA